MTADPHCRVLAKLAANVRRSSTKWVDVGIVCRLIGIEPPPPVVSVDPAAREPDTRNALLRAKPTRGLEPRTPSLRVMCSTS